VKAEVKPQADSAASKLPVTAAAPWVAAASAAVIPAAMEAAAAELAH